MRAGGRELSVETNYTFLGDKGWCFGGSDIALTGTIESREECWDGCLASFQDGLVAVDFWPTGFDGDSASQQKCFCQDQCYCLANPGKGAELLTKQSFANTETDLPSTCYENPLVIAEDVGWCEGGIDYAVGATNSVSDCWSRCWSVFNTHLWAVDWWESYGGACFCQDQCECMTQQGLGVRTAVNAWAFPNQASLPNGCSGGHDGNPYADGDDGNRQRGGGHGGHGGGSSVGTVAAVVSAVAVAFFLGGVLACYSFFQYEKKRERLRVNLDEVRLSDEVGRRAEVDQPTNQSNPSSHFCVVVHRSIYSFIRSFFVSPMSSSSCFIVMPSTNFFIY